ncbi:MAG: ABC-type transport auxiliary lipoprotein family protein [Sphingomicrobium sp.]
MRLSRSLVPLLIAATLGGCFGGGKAPATLYTLTPSAADPGTISRIASAGQAVTIAVPIIDKSLRTTRVAVDLGATQLQYVKDVQLVDMPDRLFQQLVSETVRRTTSRVVLDPNQSTLDPGVLVTGQLQKFNYDSATGQVVVQYDAALSSDGGRQIESRRFTAMAPSDGTSATVGSALNSAANQVATDVARWIGG